MLRLGLATAQGQHRTPNCDCNELPAGSICGVPIKFSIFLVFYSFYASAGLVHRQLRVPWWVVVCLAVGGLVLLVATILVHEFGHGITARRRGGEIFYILLWPLGGLCVHSMPQHGSVREKLGNDWWVAFNGPCTHIVMTPIWIGVTILLFLAFGIRYSWSDLWCDLNPLNPGGSFSRHPEAVELGWGVVLVLQLCATAITINELLFLFNILFPMYPMDSSKLLVTGMQLCGTPVQNAAWRFICISGACVLLLFGATAYQLYTWIIASQHSDYEHSVRMLSMGIIPIPLPILLTMGLGFWGGKQTWDLYQMAGAKRLHQHPLFSHVPRTSRMVRDLANGRPDVFVEQHLDRYDDGDMGPPAARQPTAQQYGAVRIVDGRIVR